MSLTIYPDVQHRPLSEVKVGSLILLDGSVAIALDAVEKSDRRVVAKFEHTSKQFAYYAVLHDRGVVSFGDDAVLQIYNVGSPTSEAPTRDSGTALFVVDQGCYIVLRVHGNFNDEFELRDLKTGAIIGSGSPMTTYRKWSMGVKNAFGRPAWLIKAE